MSLPDRHGLALEIAAAAGADALDAADPATVHWLTGVATEKQKDLIPAGWFEAWADATWKSDPKGMAQTPPVLRAPNGILLDLRVALAVQRHLQ